MASTTTNCQTTHNKYMEPANQVIIAFINDGMMQEAVNKLIAGLGGGIIAWYIRKKYYERQERGDKLEKTYKALFGVDDVDTMEGVVEIIEAHEEDIEELYDQVEKGREKRKEIEKKVKKIKGKIEDRHSK